MRVCVYILLCIDKNINHYIVIRNSVFRKTKGTLLPLVWTNLDHKKTILFWVKKNIITFKIK